MQIYDDCGYLVNDNTYNDGWYIGEAHNRKQAREILKEYFGKDYEQYRFAIREFLNEYFEDGQCYVVHFGKYVDVVVDDDEYLVVTDNGYEYTIDSKTLCVCDAESDARERAGYYDRLVAKIAESWHKSIRDLVKESFNEYKEEREAVSYLISDCITQELGDLISNDWSHLNKRERI